MNTITELTNVPSFTFHQDLTNDNEGSEATITVKYWNGSVELEQNGESILIVPSLVKPLMKHILNNMEVAQKLLDQR